jgi:hypothetical protein
LTSYFKERNQSKLISREDEASGSSDDVSISMPVELPKLKRKRQQDDRIVEHLDMETTKITFGETLGRMEIKLMQREVGSGKEQKMA